MSKCVLIYCKAYNNIFLFFFFYGTGCEYFEGYIFDGRLPKQTFRDLKNKNPINTNMYNNKN